MAVGRLGVGYYIADPDAADDIVTGELAVNAAIEVAAHAAEAAKAANPSARVAAETVFGGPIDDDGIPAGYFGSTSSIWHIIEYGSINNPPYRPLTSGAERVGLRFEPS